MEINLLAISIGNSRLAVGTFVSGELVHVSRKGHQQQGEWTAMIAEGWSRIAGRENAAIVAASVNPPMNQPLEQSIREATGGAIEKIQWIGREIDLPIDVLTENPAETGVDRVLNIAAAYEQMGKACVVVDAGTAVTVDCCNDSGDFLGGAIAAGVSMMLASLHERTAKLPRIEFAAPPESEVFGRTTEQSIRQGIYNGLRGLVKELAERYATELGFWPDIIATGGDAAELFEGWELIHAIAPDLIFYGIAKAYADFHIKHGT